MTDSRKTEASPQTLPVHFSSLPPPRVLPQSIGGMTLLSFSCVVLACVPLRAQG